MIALTFDGNIIETGADFCRLVFVASEGCPVVIEVCPDEGLTSMYPGVHDLRGQPVPVVPCVFDGGHAVALVQWTGPESEEERRFQLCVYRFAGSIVSAVFGVAEQGLSVAVGVLDVVAGVEQFG